MFAKRKPPHRLIDEDQEPLLGQGDGLSRDSSTSPADGMVAAKVTISQQTLVSENGNRNPSSRGTQYAAGVIATVGGLICGTILGWTSPTTIPLTEKQEYGFPVTKEDMSWIGGCMPLGAIFGSVLTGVFIDVVGRKNMILYLLISCLAGWASIIWSQAVWMFWLGRFLNGITVGGYCIAVPIYTAELSEKEIRGTLGTYFQLQITIGIPMAYILGYYVDVFTLSLICAAVPVVYGCLMSILPETPHFHLKTENLDKARKSLTFFRGSRYDGETEIATIQGIIDKDKEEKVKFTQAFQTTAAKRGLLIGLGVMFLQQFSGCNAVIFYSTSIFKDAGSTLDPSLCTIIVGIMSAAATWVATVVIDRLGRRILLLFSIVMMAVCTLALSVYFYLKDNAKMDLSSVGWLPVTSVSGYIIVFSLGFGPIPWMLMGEIFPSRIRGAASSIACFFNWFCVFLITKFFTSFAEVFGPGNTFLFFTLCSFFGIFFVYIFVPETKGRTLDEIQELLGAQRVALDSPKDIDSNYTSKIRL